MTDAVARAGQAAGGRLLSDEIARARADAPALGHVPHEPCANCGTMLVGPWCHACGQEGHVHRTAGALVHDLAHGVFHFEGKLAATLPLLAWRPGELTRRYVAGERAKFVSPVALFLFSVFLLFTVVANLPGEGHLRVANAGGLASRRAAAENRLRTLADERARTPDGPGRRALDRQIAAAADEDRALASAGSVQDAVEGKPMHIRLQTGIRFIDEGTRHAVKNPALTLYKIKSYGYKYSWALIPLSLPFLWLLFAFRRDVGLYDHAVFATYSLSFMSLGAVAVAVLGAIGLGMVGKAAALVVPPIHMYRQLRGAYRLGRVGALWRTAALLAIVITVALLFLALLLYLGSH